MYKKILSTFFSFSIVIAVISIILTTLALYFFFSGQLNNELKEQINLLKPGVEELGDNYLKQIKTNDRITLIKNNGDVIYDNYQINELPNHSDRIEIQQALEKGEGFSVRFSETLNENTIYYALKLSNGDILRVSTEQKSLFQILFGFLQYYLIIILIAIIISFFLAQRLAKKITDSINNINPEKPVIDISYPELIPLLRKIENQNFQINENLNKVKRQQADFQTISANMNEGIIITDQEGIIKNINPSAHNLLDNQKINKNHSIFQLFESPNLRKQITEAFKGVKSNFLLTSKDKTLSLIISPIIVAQKQSGLVIIILDITERAQRERLRSEYIANVSHELKTPLTSISGFAEIINNGLVKSEDIVRFTQNIYEESQHLIQMVNNILTISFLDEKNNLIQMSKVNLKIICEEIIDRLENNASQKEIRLRLITKGNPKIIGNQEILMELIYNLVDNAIKYNKKKGNVIIFINGQNSKKVFIKIIDNGVGISKENQKRIFDRFFRIDKNHSSKIKGTGLGLSIVKHAAVIHNATINIKSIPKKGSVFILELNRKSN